MDSSIIRKPDICANLRPIDSFTQLVTRARWSKLEDLTEEAELRPFRREVLLKRYDIFRTMGKFQDISEADLPLLKKTTLKPHRERKKRNVSSGFGRYLRSSDPGLSRSRKLPGSLERAIRLLYPWLWKQLWPRTVWAGFKRGCEWFWNRCHYRC